MATQRPTDGPSPGATRSSDAGRAHGDGTQALGKPLSYTQNLEDYHLSLAFGEQRSGVYIDIGAGHPIADNVSMWFYERGWHGIVVEPQPALAGLYRHVRPRDTLYSGLIGAEVGETEFFFFPRLHGLSTTVAASAERSQAHGDTFRKVRMPMTTLARLCETHSLTRIDFLKIDVEGAEGAVLAGNDWTRFRPKVVVVEAIAPDNGEPSHEHWEPMLLEAGYVFRLDDTLNRFYVASEQHEILARLPAERGDWAAVTHMYEIGRAPDGPQHPDNALCQDLTRGFWASLPAMDREALAKLLARGRGIDPASDEGQVLAASLETDAVRAALARIACGYDGGQI